MSRTMLIILSPPRSFSSVVSTMIGQHPQLYCFPELHLFVADTVGEILDREAKKENYTGPPGVLRALAEIQYGVQTTGTIIKAGSWLVEMRHWSTKELVDYLCGLVAPAIAVEKSPITCSNIAFLRRAYAYYPDAYYLHLTRHPVSTRQSMDEFFTKRNTITRRRGREGRKAPIELDQLLIWYQMHKNIMEFTSKLPTGQVLRLKGEDVLSEPDRYLPQIADWLGVRTDRAAIEEMKHPENSPYARVGPAPARGGNDGKFMRSPVLREGRVREPSLRNMLATEEVAWVSEKGRNMFREAGFDFRPEAEITAEVEGMAHCLGYR
jgi:hypothetical protein